MRGHARATADQKALFVFFGACLPAGLCSKSPLFETTGGCSSLSFRQCAKFGRGPAQNLSQSCSLFNEKHMMDLFGASLLRSFPVWAPVCCLANWTSMGKERDIAFVYFPGLERGRRL